MNVQSIIFGCMENLDIYNRYGDLKIVVKSNKMYIKYSQLFFYWTANIIDNVFYLLEIYIHPLLRGKGHGNRLYEIITHIAKNLNCVKIQQTPSGTTWNNETRLNYLLRRGWLKCGSEVYKVL